MAGAWLASALDACQCGQELLVAALLVGDLGLGRLRHPRLDRIDRLDHEEEERRRSRHERDRGRDERAVAEDRVVYREREVREVGLAHEHRDDRHDQVAHERVDQRSERETEDERDGELDEVAAHDEVAKLLEHRCLPPRVVRFRDVLGEILTAIVTPFKTDGSVDLDAFRRLASHLVANGSDGVVVTGTTGEAPTLSDDERFALYEAAVDEVGDGATVVAGTGTYSTSHSVHLTERAHELGVDGILVVTPYYNKPPVRGIVEHFRAIAEVTDRPIVVYNIPGRVVLNLETETIAQLAEIPRVRAVKQAYADLGQARAIVELGLDLYAGDDDLVFPFLELGGRGGVCVHTHVVGPQVKEMA